MKRQLLLRIGGLVGIAAFTACAIHYPRQKIRFEATTSASRADEGRHLALLMCATCHYDPATKKLTGTRLRDLPGFVGTVYSRNITQHPDAGIGQYTDSELVYLLRTGVAKDGTLMPYMQKPLLADEDIQAIIAFLRSDDELVAPSPIEPPPTHYSVIGKLGLRVFSPPLRYSEANVAKPDTTDEPAYGKYLTTNLGCYECHSASFLTLDRLTPEKSKGYLVGGNKLRDTAGKTVYSRNLTPDATGIGEWSEQDFIAALKTGIGRDGKVLAYPMPSFAELTDSEAAAIYRYLKSVPAIRKEVKR